MNPNCLCLLRNSPVLLAAIVASAGCHREQAQEQARAALALEPAISDNRITFPANAPELHSLIVADAKESPQDAARFNGRLTWDENVTVRVFSPFAGRVLRVAGELGATVEKDAPLAYIASPDFGQAQADARKAATDLAQAERNVNRLRELLDHGAAAAKDVASAEADLARAQAEATRARARLSLYGASAEAIDNNYQLKTPIGGVIVERNVSAGQEVRPDQMLAGLDRIAAPLFVVTDPTRLWAQLDVLEADLPKLQRGQMVQVRSTTNPQRLFPARIEVIADALDPLTRTIKARASVPNADRQLKSEMLVSIEARSSIEEAVEVPSTAVFFLGDRHYAYAKVTDQAFERREVQIGNTLGGSVQVLRGLRSGERVVCDGAMLLEQIWENRTQASKDRPPENATAGAFVPSFGVMASSQATATE